jgi:hypothetical protein
MRVRISVINLSVVVKRSVCAVDSDGALIIREFAGSMLTAIVTTGLHGPALYEPARQSLKPFNPLEYAAEGNSDRDYPPGYQAYCLGFAPPSS